MIGVLPIGTSYSLGCLSLCSNAIGFYGTYKVNATCHLQVCTRGVDLLYAFIEIC